VALVDAFDAMTHNRVYRSARSVADAMGEISRLAGRQFDPNVAPLLIEEASRGPLLVPGSNSAQGQSPSLG
jgi:HD-GYP domain-containing protein (c-di-GMP phosphodiesterase class II)